MKKIPFLTDLIATGFYTGKMPFMPGTFGSLPAIPLAYFASSLVWQARLAIFVIMFFVGVYVSDRFAKISGIKDPGCVVIDEIAALFLIYIIFPFNAFYIIAGFVFFRLFDILKPFPVNYAEELPGGLGIMADDIVAAVYAFGACVLVKFVGDYFNLWA